MPKMKGEIGGKDGRNAARLSSDASGQLRGTSVVLTKWRGQGLFGFAAPGILTTGLFAFFTDFESKPIRVLPVTCSATNCTK